MLPGNVIVLSEFMVSRTLNDIFYESSKKEKGESKNMNAFDIFSIILNEYDSRCNYR